ncbi:ATP-binding protein [Rhodohalobacter sp. SW132]|uniref:ATP-binding protein n=1 Tax=Rhodohalobacter sp. SW132 TaxID=2293433 RepID=UPI000E257708|nr:ATP-binding protein [Rhodohalobacter sp. SW132]REL24487.1 ATP-binding protein [Rhodohalobacter sp. SW132]
MSYITRELEKEVRSSLLKNPVTAVLGPRQCGKSTLVKQIIKDLKDVIYLDLERPSDLQKLNDPEWFLSSQKEKLVCLDEIQRHPDLFPVIRSLVDEDRTPGRFLILGSASRDLIKQSSESLAGRISYKTLTPFLWSEISDRVTMEQYIARGGFPISLLSNEEPDSYEWRRDFISTFLERDLLQFAGFTSVTMRRLWQMLAHSNGQMLNLSSIGESLGVSHTTVRNYVDLLEHTFMVKQLHPWRGNTRKRLMKSPKVYLTDSGIIAALLQLNGFDQVAGHPVFGSLWESIVLMQLKAHFPNAEFSYYRTNHGNELDLILSFPNKIVAVECKATVAPSLTKGTYKAAEDVGPDRLFVAAPVDQGYPMNKDVEVVSLNELIKRVDEEV